MNCSICNKIKSINNFELIIRYNQQARNVFCNSCKSKRNKVISNTTPSKLPLNYKLDTKNRIQYTTLKNAKLRIVDIKYTENF